ncbi:MAG: hypothetical protein JNL11_18705 [Bdellovibrionaceae bacterium]|nr:hypothetical protein [Pseudobdellovibrionaceae bacterium]
MKEICFLLFSIFFLGQGFAQECKKSHLHLEGIPDFKNYFENSKFYECAEQELVDPLMDTWRLQDFVLHECQKKTECIQFLKNKYSEIAAESASRLQSDNAIYIWGELIRFSGFYRRRLPDFSEFPLAGDPVALFDNLKKAKLASRELNQNETVKVACAAFFGIVGPGKLKVAKSMVKAAAVVKSVKLIDTIEIGHDAAKLIKNFRVPKAVLKNFDKWKDSVKKQGLLEVRKIPGYHDEPYEKVIGARSFRLSDGWRVFYKIENQDGKEIISVFKISLHEY